MVKYDTNMSMSMIGYNALPKRVFLKYMEIHLMTTKFDTKFFKFFTSLVNEFITGASIGTDSIRGDLILIVIMIRASIIGDWLSIDSYYIDDNKTPRDIYTYYTNKINSSISYKEYILDKLPPGYSDYKYFSLDEAYVYSNTYMHCCNKLYNELLHFEQKLGYDEGGNLPIVSKIYETPDKNQSVSYCNKPTIVVYDDDKYIELAILISQKNMCPFIYSKDPYEYSDRFTILNVRELV